MAGIQDFISKFSMVQQSLEGAVGPSEQDLIEAVCPKTMWDKFIEGLNRVIKPILLLSIILMFHWAAQNPQTFTAFANAISALPEMAWYTIFAVVSSYVVIRSWGDIRGKNTMGPSYTTTIRTNQPDLTVDIGRMANDDLHHDLVSELPLGNAAIEAWKQNEV